MTLDEAEAAFASTICPANRASARAALRRLRAIVATRGPPPTDGVIRRRAYMRAYMRKRRAEIKPRSTVDYNRKDYTP